MYSQPAVMAAPQKPETFMLSTEAQQALPPDAQVALQQVDNLKYFLISAPVDWQPDQYIRRFLLPTGEYVSCVLWNNLFHISGTDIVRCLSFRFQAFGRPVKNSKKFEEGIFSDLRNLKSGTDASLEEPKSPFLDFLYKNNCIRTQKKQKVFYWYSVPHDRLFLDALERDLKREKMGQEATTVAVSEPALSFQYDSSQSLYEQLTKAQQANSSSFNAQQLSFPQSQSTSPVMRAIDQMPPPQMPQMMTQTMAPDGMEGLGAYGGMAMPPTAQHQQHQLQHQQQHQHQHQHQQQQQHPHPHPQQNQQQYQAVLKREADYGRLQCNPNGVHMSQAQQRHASMPAYGLEYSPAPSFVSSHYEDYSQRGISFEPLTPPQQALGLGAEPAYIANEETDLYTAIPDLNAVNGLNGLNGMMQLPPSNLTGPSFSRSYAGNNVYSVIEGSPTYKQRRRRSSIPPSMTNMTNMPPTTTPHRPSDLRRSVSNSVGPVAEGDESADNSPPGLTYSNSVMSLTSQQHKDILDLSRHGTPLSTVEGSPALLPMSLQPDFSSISDELGVLGECQVMHANANVVRRARSATVMELGPYPQKSHTCPIPTCGRLFKRLEHLKRHVRTHTHERPYTCPNCSKAFSRSDNLAQHKKTHERDGIEGNQVLSGEEEADYSGEDHFGSLGDGSPASEGGYVTASVHLAMHGSPSTCMNGIPPTSMPPPHSFDPLQTFSKPMTMSQPHAINAGAM